MSTIYKIIINGIELEVRNDEIILNQPKKRKMTSKQIATAVKRITDTLYKFRKNHGIILMIDDKINKTYMYHFYIDTNLKKIAEDIVILKDELHITEIRGIYMD